MATFPITTFTPNSAQQNLQDDGINALGLATVLLSPRWSDATPTFSEPNLTLNMASIRAPFRGILQFTFSAAASTLAAGAAASATTLNLAPGTGNGFPAPTLGSVQIVLSSASGNKREIVHCTARTGDTLTVVRGMESTQAQAFDAGDRVTLRLTPGTRTSEFYDAAGNPLTGAAAVLRLHPQAILRLERLVSNRHGDTTRPVPWAMVIQGAAGFTTPRWFQPDELMAGLTGNISFHDGRGFIICPVAVAALLSDLQTQLPGVIVANPGGAANSAGGVQTIAGLASGVRVHCLDLHGRVFQSPSPGATLITQNAGNTQTGTVPASGLGTVNAGDGISATGDNNRLRWGWATTGLLARTRLVPPASALLARQFFRIFVADVDFFLIGNRSDTTVQNVGPAEQVIPAELRPVVRDQVTIDYLADGPDMLAEANRVLTRANTSMVLAVSPQLDGTMAIPTALGPAAHWPQFPGPNTATAMPPNPPSPGVGLTASFVAAPSHDVVVTIPAGAVPDGASVRIYPRQFVTIPAITAEPSYLRGNGAAGIAAAGQPTVILLPNPLALADGSPRPNPANLQMDIVVTPRVGRRRLWGAIQVTVAAGPAALPADPFAGGNPVGPLPDMVKAVAPSPLFGIPTTLPAPGAPPPGGVVAFVRALASEETPRQGPRLPTMARFDTIVVSGATGGNPAGTLLWDGVLSGGRFARESRSAEHDDGNPGNPGGPDVHAPAVRATGALAYDLAYRALKRAQPIIPLFSAPSPGWVVASGGDNLNPPTDNNAANTSCGVLLETIAAVCETPELSPLTPPAAGLTVMSMVDDLADAIGISNPLTGVTIGNEVRLQREVRREFFVSKFGLRDALWSVRRALRQARELVYIESPAFARTARPAGAPLAHEIDLVAELAAALQASQNLRVLICTPRESDFSERYKGWSRLHFQNRNEAVGDLLAVAPDRVAVFHPVGFPGRTAHLRTTSIIVDDVWCLVGTTHFRRRGFTFDGSCAVASFDRQMDSGYSRDVRNYRRARMAQVLAVPAPAPGAPSGDWLRLGRPLSSFELVQDWLSQGGLGRIQPLWPGPSDTSIAVASQNQGDPDGSDGATFVTALASLLGEIGD